MDAAESSIEQALAAHDPADIYDIYFTFNSDSIRDESEPRLAEIADVMRRHADWKLVVQGHTDSIGSDVANLRLSTRRAAGVKNALVKHYNIDPRRLTTEGYGRTRPRDTNATLKGRARNRRVELVRL
jgi:outer membrane protein OmpA-like peptidoglycan-associated protein